MFEVILSNSCVRKLKERLDTAKSKEIGGVMAAEQIEDGTFLVVDMSYQLDGTHSHFMRDPVQHGSFIDEFHEKVGNQPQRFNYLGEWHSHPSFPALPSPDDFNQMQLLVEDADQRSSFLILLIVKLKSENELWGSVYGFRPNLEPVRGRLTGELHDVNQEESTPILFVLLNLKDEDELSR